MRIPAEIRLKTYAYVFHGTVLVVAVVRSDNNRHISYLYPRGTTIDNRITLTGHLIRAETLPVLHQSLTLLCDFQMFTSAFQALNGESTTLGIKSKYLPFMRKANFSYDKCFDKVPFDKISALKKVSIVSREYISITSVYRQPTKLLKCAASMDLRDFLRALKLYVFRKPPHMPYHLLDILNHPDRGFTLSFTCCITAYKATHAVVSCIHLVTTLR